MGTSVASKPVNSFVIVIYDLRPTYKFFLPSLTAPLEMVALLLHGLTKGIT